MESIEHSWRPAAAGDPAKSQSEVQNLRSSPSLRMSPASSGTDSLMQGVAEATLPVKAAGKSPIKAGTAVNIGTLDLEIGSESEVAVSANGTNIVVARLQLVEHQAIAC